MQNISEPNQIKFSINILQISYKYMEKWLENYMWLEIVWFITKMEKIILTR